MSKENLKKFALIEVAGFGLKVEKSSVILIDKKKPFSYGISQTVYLGTVTNTSNKRKRTYSAEIWLLDGKCWPNLV